MWRPIILLAVLSGLATAQDSRVFTARILCFQQVGDLSKIFAPSPDNEDAAEGGMLEVTLYQGAFSDEFRMRATNGEGVFSLPGEGPDEAYRQLPGADLPSSSDIIFLFLPSSETKENPYRIVALPSDEDSFPYESVRLMNLYGEPLRFHLGEHNGRSAINLAPGKTTLVDQVTRVDDYNRYPVLVQQRTPEGFSRIYRTNWQSIEGKRDIVIVYPDASTGSPKLNHYEDIKPADLDDG